jgi:hypothetical protein
MPIINKYISMACDWLLGTYQIIYTIPRAIKDIPAIQDLFQESTRSNMTKNVGIKWISKSIIVFQKVASLSKVKSNVKATRRIHIILGIQ